MRRETALAQETKQGASNSFGFAKVISWLRQGIQRQLTKALGGFAKEVLGRLPRRSGATKIISSKPANGIAENTRGKTSENASSGRQQPRRRKPCPRTTRATISTNSGNRLQNVSPSIHGTQKKADGCKRGNVTKRDIHIQTPKTDNTKIEAYLLNVLFYFLLCSFYVLFFIKSTEKFRPT